MKKIEKVVEYEYVAEDGTVFYNEKDCLCYEKYYKRDFLELISKYYILDSEAKEKIRARQTPVHCYVLCIKTIPLDVANYIAIHSGLFNYNPLPTRQSSEKTIYYYNYREGWKHFYDKDYLENKIKFYEKSLAMFKELESSHTKVES